jgi:hypothetical protein
MIMRKELMFCFYCHEAKELINAHVIPEYFFRQIIETDGSKKKMLYLKKTELEYMQRAPKGIYDSGILCKSCDNEIGKLDDYAIKFFQNSASWQKTYSNNLIYYKPANCNYKVLKLFFISLLWRASITTNPFFGLVKLGPFEEEAYRRLKSKEPGDKHSFSVIMFKLSNTKDASLNEMEIPIQKHILNPTTTRVEGRKFYRIHLNEFFIVIKVDGRKINKGFDSITLRENAPLIIPELDFDETPFKQWMLEIVNS